MKYTQGEEPLKVLNERGWNLYAVKDIDGNPHRGFVKIIENGLAVPWDEFLRRQQEGDAKGIQPFGFGDTIDYLLFPVCDEPNSVAAVDQRTREIRSSGSAAARYAGMKLTFKRRDTLSLDALPDLQSVSGQA